MRRLYILIFVVVAFLGNSQEQKKSAPFTVRGGIGIPRTIISNMFRTAFNGVYEANLSFNKRIFNNFFIGMGYQNSHFQNNKAVFATKVFVDPKSGQATGNSISYNTRLDGHAGFLKVGYDRFFNKGYVSYALNVGYMSCKYLNVNGDTSDANKPLVGPSFGAAYVQPELGINFMTDGRLTFSLLLGYTTMLDHFNPREPRFNQFGEVNEKSNKYFMSWLTIGFGFNILFGDIKSYQNKNSVE
jgi:hypothetical protein